MLRLSTRARIIAATFAPLLLFVLLGAGTAVAIIPRIIERLVLQRQIALAEVAAAGVAGEMQGHLRLLLSTADDIGAVAIGLAADDALAAEQVLGRRASLLEVFTGGVTCVGLDGAVLATTGAGSEARPGVSFGHATYLASILASRTPVFSSLVEGQPGRHSRVMVGMAARRQGQVVGAVVGAFDLQRNTWARNLALLRTPQGGTVSLIDSASTVIYDLDPRQIGHTVQQDIPQLWQMVLAGEPASLALASGGGPREVVAYAPVPGIAWGLILREPWDAIIAEAQASFWVIGGLWLAGLLIAALVLSLSVRRVLLPLDAVVTEARSVAAGGVFRPLVRSGPSDIATLVDALNRMVERLTLQQAMLRDYARRVVQGQESERQRIARDLHDETVQSLVGLGQRLELVGRALSRRDALACAPEGSEDATEALSSARRQLEHARALAEDTLNAVRRMSYHLRPFMLEDLGLVAAVQGLSHDLDAETPDMSVTCEILGDVRRLSPDIELTVFRIVQEALSNVRKHAVPGGATHISVALIYEASGIRAWIEDDGPGAQLPPVDALVRQGHLGIAGMGERARLYGGTLDTIAAPGEGMTVRLWLPDAVPEAPAD